MSVSAVSSFQPSGLPGSLVPVLPSENAVTAAAASSSSESKHLSMFADGDDSPSFMDLLDVINPLQHIPFISDLYQEATGDKIGVGARLAGGALFGGPIGLIGAAANCILEESTGHDVGGHVLALFRDGAAPGAGTALASASDSAPSSNPTVAPEQLADASAKRPQADTADGAQPLILSDLVGAETLPSIPRQVAAAAPPLPAAAPLAPVQTVSSLDPASTAQAVAAKANAAGAGRPMTIGGREPRLMPIPGRNTPIATQSPPAVGTTVSTTGTRSYAPITGARATPPAVNPAMVQQMAAAQGGNATPAQAGPTGDWFNASMMQALDKYERTSKMGQGSAGNVTDTE